MRAFRLRRHLNYVENTFGLHFGEIEFSCWRHFFLRVANGNGFTSNQPQSSPQITCIILKTLVWPTPDTA